jgi:hypothetical protein
MPFEWSGRIQLPDPPPLPPPGSAPSSGVTQEVLGPFLEGE